MRFLCTTAAWGIASLVLCQCTPQGPATAPNPGARAADQLDIAGNACGPTALLNAWRFGSIACQNIAATLPGADDRARLRHLIVHHGGQRSTHMPHRNRWSRRGINAADLTDLANQLMDRHGARPVTLIVPQGKDSLRTTHRQLARSLRRGFPPVVSLRRYVGTKVIESHFVTVLRVPDHLEKNASFFTMEYLDPIGGKKCHGRLTARESISHTQLLADTPSTPVGRSQANTDSCLLMDSLIVMP
jgi:hypothetical protein